MTLSQEEAMVQHDALVDALKIGGVTDDLHDPVHGWTRSAVWRDHPVSGGDDQYGFEYETFYTHESGTTVQFVYFVMLEDDGLLYLHEQATVGYFDDHDDCFVPEEHDDKMLHETGTLTELDERALELARIDQREDLDGYLDPDVVRFREYQNTLSEFLTYRAREVMA